MYWKLFDNGIFFQLFESRSKHVLHEEMALWSNVTQEVMSDEEDLGDSLKIKTPQWRSEEVTRLIRILDERTNAQKIADGKQTLKKTRVLSDSPMKRRPSKKLKTDLIRDDD